MAELIKSWYLFPFFKKGISKFVIFGTNSTILRSEKNDIPSFTNFFPQNCTCNRFLCKYVFFLCRMSLKISQETEEAQIIMKKIMTDFSKFSWEFFFYFLHFIFLIEEPSFEMETFETTMPTNFYYWFFFPIQSVCGCFISHLNP